MTESKHTPGPWEVAEGDREGQLVIQETTTGMGLRIAFLGDLGPEKMRANAELLARAPDLLREVEDLRAQNAELLGLLERVKDEKGFTCDCGISEGVFDGMDTAIAKAKGGVA